MPVIVPKLWDPRTFGVHIGDVRYTEPLFLYPGLIDPDALPNVLGRVVEGTEAFAQGRVVGLEAGGKQYPAFVNDNGYLSTHGRLVVLTSGELEKFDGHLTRHNRGEVRVWGSDGKPVKVGSYPVNAAWVYKRMAEWPVPSFPFGME